MERPPIRYTKTIDGLQIAYQVVGSGPFDLLWDKQPPDADYVILADPEGNRFCVVDTAR